MLRLLKMTTITAMESEADSAGEGSPAASEEGLLIYIAGPYSQPDPVQNTHAVIKVADALSAAGFVPLVPHLSLAWQFVSPQTLSSCGEERTDGRKYDTSLEVDVLISNANRSQIAVHSLNREL